MKPGRELDELVAEKVMGLFVGWKRFSGSAYFGVGTHHNWFNEGPEWSKEKFQDLGEDSSIYSERINSAGDKYRSVIPDDYQSYGWLECGVPVPGYSTDIRDAMGIIEKLGKNDDVRIEQTSGGWRVWWDQSNATSKHAETLALAICLAALKSMGVE